MAWSVDIGAIPPPAPGWDTGWGEEGEGSGEGERHRRDDMEVRNEELKHLLCDIKMCSDDQHLFVNFYECEKIKTPNIQNCSNAASATKC